MGKKKTPKVEEVKVEETLVEKGSVKSPKRSSGNTKGSYYPEPGDSLPNFTYAFMGNTCYLLLGGNRAKIKWNKRNIPASEPFYCLPSKIGFDSDYSKEYNMKVGDSIWEGQYDDCEDISGGIYLNGHFEEIYESSNPDVASIDYGETRGEYVIYANAPGTAILKITRVYAGNIRYTATLKVTVEPKPIMLSIEHNAQEGVSGEMEPIEADAEGNVTLPQPTFVVEPGKSINFDWYKFDLESETIYQPGDVVNITEDTTIYAVYSVHK
jgi:hypothetical protein